MMPVEFDTSGLDKALKQMVSQEKKVRNRGLKRAGEAIARRLEENTPVESKPQDKHMKDDIVVSGVNVNGEIQVGFGKDTAWRAHFVEMGTIKQPPQSFIQRTEEDMQDEVLRIMQDEFRKGLGL